MNAPPEPLRSQFLKFLVEARPWFRVGAPVVFVFAGNRRMTLRRINPDDWSFHAQERGRDKWLKFRLYDVISHFRADESPLDKIDAQLGESVVGDLG